MKDGPGKPQSEVKQIRPVRYRDPVRNRLVGLGGLEPPTSRLSGGRSNQAELQAPRTD